MKNPRIILLAVIVIIITLTIGYNSNSNTALLVDESVESNINNDDEVANINAQNEENIQTKTSATLENNVQYTPLSKDAFKCFPMTEIQKLVNQDTLEEFASDNVLFPASVPQYLTRLEKDELVAEFEVGNASAAYVLGMNIFYSSHNTNFHHPVLIAPGTRELTADDYGKSLKELNAERLNEAREWLWIAAVNGVSSALAEIGVTYRYEHDFLEADYQKSQGDLKDVEKRLKALKVIELSYTVLHVEVAPQVYDLFGGEKEYFEKKLEQITHEDKERLYEEIETKWVKDRFNIGQSKEVELKVPEEIKIAAKIYRNQCF